MHFEAWAKRAVRRRGDAIAPRWTGVFPPAATSTAAIPNVWLTSTPAVSFAQIAAVRATTDGAEAKARCKGGHRRPRRPVCTRLRT